MNDNTEQGLNKRIFGQEGIADVTSDDEMADIFDGDLYLNRFELKAKRGKMAS
jgi:hypothetical protein